MESSHISSYRGAGNAETFRKIRSKNALPRLVNLNNVKVNPYQKMNKTFDNYTSASSNILNQPLNLNSKSIFGGGVSDNNQGINNT